MKKKITLLGALILCFNKQEKHIDQKEAVCTHAHKTNSLSRTSENREREYVILQGSSSRRLLPELTCVFGKKSHLLGDEEKKLEGYEKGLITYLGT